MRKREKRVVLEKASIPGRRYREDKPRDCRYCYFWTNTGCISGDACIYILKEETNKPKGKCENCTYARSQPCIGFCMKDIVGGKRIE